MIVFLHNITGMFFYGRILALSRRFAGVFRVLIVGTGYSGAMRVAPDVEGYLREKGIRFIAAMSTDAVRQYNELVDDGGVALGIHLTC